jgi:hypothetical protein
MEFAVNRSKFWAFALVLVTAILGWSFVAKHDLQGMAASCFNRWLFTLGGGESISVCFYLAAEDTAKGYAWASAGGDGWEYVILLTVVFAGDEWRWHVLPGRLVAASRDDCTPTCVTGGK